MKRFFQMSVCSLITISLLACGAEGAVDLKFTALERDIEVNFDNETRAVNIEEINILLDSILIDEDVEDKNRLNDVELVGLFNENGINAVLLVFEEETEVLAVNQEFTVPGLFNEIFMDYDEANAEAALLIDDPEFEGNAVRLKGTIDLDGDPKNGLETNLIIRIPPPFVGPTLLQLVRVLNGSTAEVEIELDLAFLLSFLDFSTLTPVDGELIIDANTEPVAANLLSELLTLGSAYTSSSEIIEDTLP